VLQDEIEPVESALDLLVLLPVPLCLLLVGERLGGCQPCMAGRWASGWRGADAVDAIELAAEVGDRIVR
jgi:hypothetical protein